MSKNKVVKKKYFVSFEFIGDYYGSGHSVIEINIENELIMDSVKMLINFEFPSVNTDDIEIKILAFNNIK